VALLLLGIYLVAHPLLRFAGKQLIEEDPLGKSDAIGDFECDNFTPTGPPSGGSVPAGAGTVVVPAGFGCGRTREFGIDDPRSDRARCTKEKIIPFPTRRRQQQGRSAGPAKITAAEELEESDRGHFELSHSPRENIASKIFGMRITVRWPARGRDFDPANCRAAEVHQSGLCIEVAGMRGGVGTPLRA